MRHALLLLLPLALLGCRTPLAFRTPLPPDDAFARAEPTAEELVRYERAARYSRDEDGRALLIVKGDAVVFEDYAQGHSAQTPWHLFSGTKTFAGALALAAIEDGLLDLDELASDTLPELKRDPLQAKIRVRHLLRFTSGLETSFRLAWDAVFAKEDQRVANKYAAALKMVPEAEPGKTWRYGNAHLLLFGELMRRKLHGDPLAYLRRRVLDPIGFRFAGWHHDAAGNPMFSLGCWTTAWEWAKFGVFLRDRGAWRGEQIVPAELFEAMFTGSTVMPAYGMTCWLNRPVGDGADDLDRFRSLADGARYGGRLSEQAPDLIAAAGLGNQRLYVIPSRDLVVVRLADGELSFRDRTLIGLLLGDPAND